jgi:hypothetical protein
LIQGPGLPVPAYGQGQAPESIIFKELQKTWTPFFNGVTTFYETIKSSSYQIAFNRILSIDDMPAIWHHPFRRKERRHD